MPAALVTGVSRTRGIAATVARRLRDDGFSVVTAGWTPYDTEHHQATDDQVTSDLQCDLADPSAPRRVLEAAERQAGLVTSLVLAHAFDAGLGLFEATSESIDQHMAVNVRSFLLSPDAAFINGQLITSDGGHAVAAGSWPR